MELITRKYRPINPALLWEEVKAEFGDNAISMDTGDPGIVLRVADETVNAESRFDSLLAAHDKDGVAEQDKHDVALAELAKLSGDELAALVETTKGKAVG